MATPNETLLEALLAGPEGADEETPETEVEETPETVAPPVVAEPLAVVEAPVSQGPRVLSLDDLTPDVPDLPPTRRGAPVRALIDDRRLAIQQAIDAGNEKNAALARAAVLEETVRVLTRRFGEPPAPAVVEPPPPETSLDALRRRTDPASLQYDPEGVLAATLEAAEERSAGAMSETEKKIRADLETQRAELDRRIAVIEQRESTARTIGAYRTAFPDRDPTTDPDLDDISFLIESINNAAITSGQTPPLPVDDPKSYLTAAARLDAIAARRIPPAPVRPAPVVVQPSATAQAQVAPPPAPPVGSGAPNAAAPTAVAVTALPQHERAAFGELLNLFPQLRGKPELIDEIAGEVAASSAAGIHPYSRQNVKRSARA